MERDNIEHQPLRTAAGLDTNIECLPKGRQIFLSR